VYKRAVTTSLLKSKNKEDECEDNVRMININTYINSLDYLSSAEEWEWAWFSTRMVLVVLTN
jgi:hypothetical protein